MATSRQFAGYGLLLLLALFFNPILESPVAAQTSLPQTGVVTRIADGDTVRVRFADGVERRVRLIGVNSPEIDDPRDNVALWGQLAKRFTFYHLYRRTVQISYDFETWDVHGRVLAYIWTDEKGLFNEFLIRQGYASAFLSYPFRRDYQKLFQEAEAEARKKGRGLWTKEDPEAISVDDIRPHLGKFISVRFTCAQLRAKRSFVYLSTSRNEFEALIPSDRRNLFADLKAVQGKELVVTGFLEDFKGRPQILLFFPRQIRILGLTSNRGWFIKPSKKELARVINIKVEHV